MKSSKKRRGIDMKKVSFKKLTGMSYKQYKKGIMQANKKWSEYCKLKTKGE
jgi:hypothetical protein